MKINRFIAGALALCLAGVALPVSEKVVSGFSLSAYAEEEYTEGTYGVLTYKNYGDYIEISGCDTSAEGEVVIPSEIECLPVTSIGSRAFLGCTSLTEINIPDSVTSIGIYAFSQTPWLESQRQISPLVIVNNIVIDGYTCEGDVIIPDGVTSIGANAFLGCTSITSITIPDGVTSIETYAFRDCKNLTSVTITYSVISIGVRVFEGCTSLTEINIPDSVTSIGSYAFFQTPWLESQRQISPLVIVNNIVIDGYTCEGDVIIPDGVTSIGDDAFLGCTSITSIIIPDSITSIGNGAFTGCKNLTEITIENSECTIYDSENTISNTATIYGYENSTAQAYAEKYGRNFVIIGEDTTATELLPGDADGNGKVEIADAVKIMCYVTDSENTPMTAEEIEAADVYQTGDGLSVQDALSIQKYLAQIITELPEK